MPLLNPAEGTLSRPSKVLWVCALQKPGTPSAWFRKFWMMQSGGGSVPKRPLVRQVFEINRGWHVLDMVRKLGLAGGLYRHGCR